MSLLLRARQNEALSGRRVLPALAPARTPARINENTSKFTNGAVKGKTGSLTALPIIETGGRRVGLRSDNVISITDGQIFLETDPVQRGRASAINASISVSRVGGACPTKVIKSCPAVSVPTWPQYRELAAFAQFASDLDDATRRQLRDAASAWWKQLKQPQCPAAASVGASRRCTRFSNGYLDDVDVAQILALRRSLKDHLRSQSTPPGQRIEDTRNCQGRQKPNWLPRWEFQRNAGFLRHLSGVAMGVPYPTVGGDNPAEPAKAVQQGKRNARNQEVGAKIKSVQTRAQDPGRWKWSPHPRCARRRSGSARVVRTPPRCARLLRT